MKKKILKSVLTILSIATITCTLSGCNNTTNNNYSSNEDEDQADYTQIKFDLMPYIHQLMSETKSSEGGYIPSWNKESFKDKWNYIDGVFLSSIINLYYSESDSSYIDFVKNYVDCYLTEEGEFFRPKAKTTDNAYNEGELDSVCESKILFDLYDYTKDEKYLNAIENTMYSLKSMERCTGSSNFNHKAIYPNQIWLDGMYMYAPFYARYASYTTTSYLKETILNEIVEQYKYIREHMFDEEKKLYYHGNDTSKTVFWADKTTGNSSSFWLRSEGWFVASLADVIEYYPEDGNKYYLKNLLKEALDGIYRFQDEESKMFYQVVDQKNITVEVDNTYLKALNNTYNTNSDTTKKTNYLESSGSCLIAYASLKASENGYIDSSYKKLGKEVLEGVYHHSFRENNGTYSLNDICITAGLGPEGKTYRDGSISYYLSEPVGSNDAKGVGPFIMAYTFYKLAY